MSATLAEALRLREMGFTVHWLHPGTKIPLVSEWATRPALSIAELEQTYRDGYNVGIRTGHHSVVDGKEICVLDVDIKHPAYAEEAYACAGVIMGGAFDPHVKSGSGAGRHQYLAFPVGASPALAATTLRQCDMWVLDGKPCAPGTRGARPAWLIELLSTGKQVVVPPSTHPDTGLSYQWLRRNYA